MANTLYADDGSLRITVVNGTTLTGLNAPDGSMYVVEGNPAIHRGLYHPCGAMLVKVNADSTSSSIPAYSPEGFRNISLAPFGTTITGAMRCTIVSGAFANTTIVSNTQKATAAVEFDFVNKTYKEGSNYKNLLDNIPITRASTATYVNNKGMVDTAAVNTARLTHELGTGKPLGLLLEPAATNLLIRSQDFSATWIVGSGTTITNNSDYAPDGTKTAVTINQTAGNANSYIYQVISTGVADNTVYTLSFYVKPNNFPSSDLVIGIRDQALVNFFTQAMPSLPQNIWSRVSFTFTSTVGATSLHVFPYRQPTSFLTPAVNSGTIQLWGIQVETGNAASSYIPTVGTQVTRAADTGILLNSTAFDLGLKTNTINLLVRSQEFDNARWAPGTGVTVVADNATAPDTTLTADTITVTGANPFQALSQFAVTVKPSTTYTFSQYINLGTLAVGDYKFGITDVISNTYIGGVQTPNITPISGTWVRYWYTFTTSSTTTSIHVRPYINPNTNLGGTFALWGAQLEESDIMTSYVPTVAAQVSSASFYGFTYLVKFYSKPTGSTTNSALFSISGNPGSNAESITTFHSPDVTTSTVTLSADQTPTFTATATMNGVLNKVAYAFAPNDAVYSVNGGAAITDITVTLPTGPMALACIGGAAYNTALFTPGCIISEVSIWDTKRSSAEVVALST